MPPSPTRPARSAHLAILLALSLAPGILGAQALPVGDPLEEYARVLELVGMAKRAGVTVRPAPRWAGLAVADSADHPWRRWVPGTAVAEGTDGPRAWLDPARLRAYWNSDEPYGWNDGEVWRGVGFTLALDAGGSAAWGPLSVTVHPTLMFNQNAYLPLAEVTREGATRYGHPARRMDVPQRFGPDPFWTLDPGQTMVRLTWRGVSAGFGSESLWWGPGTENAIIMSNNAPGILHGSLKTAGPIDLRIGDLEAEWIWGRPKQSRWADTATAFLDAYGLDDRRFITGAVASFQPRGLEEVTLGATRVYMRNLPKAGLGFSEYFLIFQRGLKENFVTEESPYGDDIRDQILSLFFRWAKPGSGFEAYAEWARNDHAIDNYQLLGDLAHSQGFTLGMREAKALSPDVILSLQAELTTLEGGALQRLFDTAPYYDNWAVPAGYTHRGQFIGAAIGTGGNGQTLKADVFAPWGRAGVFLTRRVWDNDKYWDTSDTNCCHDVSLTGGARSLFFVGENVLELEGTLTKAFNRRWAGRHLWNAGVAASFSQRRRHPGSGAR